MRYASIKTDIQLTSLSDYICQDCPETSRSTVAYIMFYQGGPIEHDTHVPGPVVQSSAESEYNAEWNTGMDLSHFRMLIHEFWTRIQI